MNVTTTLIPRRILKRILILATAALTAATLVAVQPQPVSATAGRDTVTFVDNGRFDIWVDASQGSGIGRVYFGDAGDVPLMGDWDCDGVDTPGVYRASQGRVYLRNELSSGPASRVYSFGAAGDVPLAGDFDGDGCDTVSVYRPSEGRVFVSNSLSGGLATSFYFGNPGDRPFVGDFDGDGIDTIGLHRESAGFVYFRNSLTVGVADWSFYYGDPGDKIIAGDWDGDGVDTVAVYRPSTSTLYLKNTNRTGIADASVWVGSHRYVTAASGIPASVANAGGVYVPDVDVYPGDDLAGLVYEWPVGTVFMVHGVHVGVEVEPRDGQVFVGAPGAVLDGGGWAEFAFSGSADDVVVQGLEIRDYDTPVQFGTVYVSGSRWLIEDNEVHGSSGGGVSVRDGDGVARDNVIRNNRIHHNHQLGMAVTGTENTLIVGNEIAYNNWLDEYDWGWEAGGTKFWETSGLVVRGNWSHHNTGPGLWSDTDNVGTLYEGNVVEDNTANGIFHEVSGSATIRNNVLRRNGFEHAAWLWGGGIVIAASGDVDIYGNRLENNFNGISLVYQERPDSHAVAGVHVWGNTLIDTGMSGAATDAGDDSIFYADNWFDSNTYIGDVEWAWDGSGGLDWGSWRSTGNGTNSTYQP